MVGRVLDGRRWSRVPFEFNRLTLNLLDCMFLVEMPETKNEKPKLPKVVKINPRADGVVIFYTGPGEPRMGVRENPKTDAMFAAIKAAYADAVAMDVNI
jgi:hypothetical protein